MKTDKHELLLILSEQSDPVTATFLTRSRKRWTLFPPSELVVSEIAPLLNAGLINSTSHKGGLRYTITPLGLAWLDDQSTKTPAPSEIVPPRTFMYTADSVHSESWGAASERGDHRHVRSLGVAC